MAVIAYYSESPFLIGRQLVKLALDKLSVWSPGNSVALLLAALVIIICFALISAQVVFIKCEAMIAMAAAVILVGSGHSYEHDQRRHGLTKWRIIWKAGCATRNWMAATSRMAARNARIWQAPPEAGACFTRRRA